MNRYILVIGIVALLGLAAAGTYYAGFAPTADIKACTQEAKLCPDGSAVGRTGPNCEFAACPGAAATTSGSSAGAGILPYTSGVRGTVLLGPTCPVERDPPDPQCADKPYATAILVFRTGAKTPFVIGNSDTNGVFQFSLPPGTYTIEAGNGTKLPSCPPTSVTVKAEGYTAVTLSCDSGIR